jgi:hypothetical protein
VPRVGHFGRDDSIQVLLEADDVDRAQTSRNDVDLDRPAVAALQLERSSCGLEEQRRRQRLRLVFPVYLQLECRRQRVRTGDDIVHRSAPVTHAEVLRGAELEGFHSARQQHAHA